MKKSLVLTILSITTLIVQAKTIYYVKEGSNGTGISWANASPNLQTVIDNSVSGDEIWVTKGTYYPTKELTVGSPRTKTIVMKNGVSLYGGFIGTETTLNQRVLTDLNLDGKVDSCEFANETILSGNIDGVTDNWTKTINADGKTWKWTITGNSNNCYRVITADAVFTVATYINGFTITAGNGNISTINGGGILASTNINILNSKFTKCSANSGGAAYLSGGTLRNCDISYCQSDYDGGAVYLYSSLSNNKYCLFEKNSIYNCVSLYGNGGGVYSNTYYSKIANSKFSNCCSVIESGGGLFSNTKVEECIIDNCVAKKNGGGICTGGDVINLSKNIIKNSSAMSGGGICYTASQSNSPVVIIDNCLVSNCSASNTGGGICHVTGSSTLNIINSTIVNCSGVYGGGVYKATLRNTAIYNCNATTQGGAAYLNSLDVIQNCAFGNNNQNGVLSNIYGNTGTNFITPDKSLTFTQPTSFIGASSTTNELTEVESSNWKLKLNSTCINAGNQQVETYILTGKDLSGNLRVNGSIIDIGAYEFYNTTGFDNIHSERVLIKKINNQLIITPRQLGDRISIYNLHGKLIISKNETINLSESGIYIVQIFSTDKTETVKVVL